MDTDDIKAIKGEWLLRNDARRCHGKVSRSVDSVARQRRYRGHILLLAVSALKKTSDKGD